MAPTSGDMVPYICFFAVVGLVYRASASQIYIFLFMKCPFPKGNLLCPLNNKVQRLITIKQFKRKLGW